MDMDPGKIKFVYFTPASIQVPRVDQQCIVYFCDALNNLGVDIEIVTMGINLLESETRADDPLDLYRIRSRFPVRIIKTPVSQAGGNRYWDAINRLWVHTMHAMRVLNSQGADKKILFYSKNYTTVFLHLLIRFLLRKNLLVVYEAHVPPQSVFQRFVLKKTDLVVANSFALGEDLVKKKPHWRRKVMGVHQGIDLNFFNESRVSKTEAREKLGLPINKKLAVYTGKVYWGYKEIEYLMEAARLLPDNIEITIVGGRKDHVDRFQEYVKEKGLSNVRLVGFVSPNYVQYYQFAADVLLLYYPSGIDLNSYRSPGKLFEYMASGRPIIAVDLPVLKEVLETAAIFVPPDSPQLLAQAIKGIMVEDEKGRSLAKQALSLVENYTWEERAKRILQFLGRNLT
jgi:glycosyltransferase involved in cell wall biosynthesis